MFMSFFLFLFKIKIKKRKQKGMVQNFSKNVVANALKFELVAQAQF